MQGENLYFAQFKFYASSLLPTEEPHEFHVGPNLRGDSPELLELHLLEH